MNSAAPTPAPAPAGHRHLSSKKRMKLRNATLIIPATGERSRRQISLRTTTGLSGTLPSTSTSASRSLSPSRQSARGCIGALKEAILAYAAAAWAFADSDIGRDVFKCSVAYLIGSMATFWPPLSNFLGNRDGKHIVATLTVYFHAARTVGSMLEAVLMGIVAVLYAEAVSLLSMAVPIVFRAKWEDYLTLAHIIVLVIFIGGGLGFVGWVKHKLNSPLSNVASTLASIAIITVVTKEDAVHWGHFSSEKPVQVFKMLVIGMSITAGVNLLVWRKSARNVVRSSAITASASLGDMLSAITQGFLNGSEEEPGPAAVSRVSARYSASQARMSKFLRELKYERFFSGHEDLYRLESAMAKALEAVAQAIGGLRSASDTQFALLRETAPWEMGAAATLPGPVLGTDHSSGSISIMSPLVSPTVTKPRPPLAMSVKGGRPQSLASIDESAERELERTAASADAGQAGSALSTGAPIFRAPSDILELFIALLGPSMKSLAWTLSEILRVSPFEHDPDASYMVTTKEQFRESLRDAIEVYNASRGNALQELYRRIEFGRSRSAKVQADIEEVAAACGHFSFSLLEVSKQTDAFLDVLDELRGRTACGKRSWRWLHVWKYLPLLCGRRERLHGAGGGGDAVGLENPEAESLLEQPVQRMRKSALPKGIPDTMVRRRDNVGWEAAPGSHRILRYASQKAMGFLRFLAREDIRFAIKVGIGAVAYAALAFMPATRPVYVHWRGEWGLLSYMIVVSMTKGAANTTGLARFVGTMVGAAFAITGWAAGGGSAVALAFIGWLVSLFNFYFILAVGNAPLGRISLLCYNVTVLYAYSLSQKVDDDDNDEGGETPEIVEICFHRAVAVTLGILWGIIVCRLIWPISGRRKCREGLAVLYLQLGLIWKRGPLATLLEDDRVRPYMRAGEQAALQRYASKIDDLRRAAEGEFSLRGPFPVQSYARIMESTAHILDGLYAMKLLADRRVLLTEGEKALLRFTGPERQQLCQRICHVFQVLASSMMLEYPLSDAVPSIVNVKDRLLGKMHRFRAERATVLASNEDEDEDEDDDDAAPVFWGGQSEYRFPAPGQGENEQQQQQQQQQRQRQRQQQHRGSETPDLSEDHGPYHSRAHCQSPDQDQSQQYPSQAEVLIVAEHDYALLYAYTLVTAQIAKELANVQREVEALFGVLDEDAMLLQ